MTIKYESLYKKEFVQIGTIRKAHGYKGHAKIGVDDRYLADLTEQKFLFIHIDGYYVPFRIEEYLDQNDHIIKLKGIESSEALKRYHLYNIALLKEDLNHAQEATEQAEEIDALLGFSIQDAEYGSVGTIERIEDYPQQKIAIVMINGSEKMIPLHPSLIEAIDTTEKVIYTALPIGLLD